MLSKKQFSLLAILIVLGCQEPIDLGFEASAPKLVIDGYITDNFRPHSIFLSFSSGFENGVFVPNRITFATVNIEDSDGRLFEMPHVGNGEYRSSAFFAREGKGYRVVVQLNGEEYRTSFEQLPENDAPAPASTYFQPELKEELSNSGIVVADEGVGVYANIFKAPQTTYYQWIIEQWYIAQAGFDLCYTRDFDIPRTVILEDNARQQGEGEDYDYRIDFVPVGVKTKVDFAVVANQLILTQEAFEFWDNVKAQGENVGSLFDAAPFSVRGNGFKVGSEELVLGYFGVYRESVSRVFFREGDLPYVHREYPCVPPPVFPNRCTDCTLWPGTSHARIKPNWWR